MTICEEEETQTEASPVSALNKLPTLERVDFLDPISSNLKLRVLNYNTLFSLNVGTGK